MKDKIIQQISKNIGMIKNIRIGDPMYFEKFKDSSLLDTLVYDRNFLEECNWIGFISITEFEDCSPVTFSCIDINISFAPNEELLNVYKNGLHYSYQKVNSKTIGVDSDSYIICINDRTSLIRTEISGYLGDTFEYYRDNELEGISISLGAGEYKDFSSIKENIETLFDIKF